MSTVIIRDPQTLQDLIDAAQMRAEKAADQAARAAEARRVLDALRGEFGPDLDGGIDRLKASAERNANQAQDMKDLATAASADSSMPIPPPTPAPPLGPPPAALQAVS